MLPSFEGRVGDGCYSRITYFVETSLLTKMALQNILPYTPEARELAKVLRKNMTNSERVFWGNVRKKQLSVQFFRQFPILEYVVDFYVKEIGLAIEIDGNSHNNRFLEDSHRQSRIEELGMKFIRFTNEQVLNDLETVLVELGEVIGSFNE
ncbi:endonuclease domain-containing protein [uncultured Aquimarina sp.]|uniref:endonuclease domain-containing protein n=1 Tax=uncultured Aquimarina sp. TaxID=575652 RepID=UPI0026242E31|nr:endonuclease domain-containing protein [uncultured Aquimarina sp.]